MKNKERTDVSEKILLLNVRYEEKVKGGRLIYTLGHTSQGHDPEMREFKKTLKEDLGKFFERFLQKLTLADFVAVDHALPDPYVQVRQQCIALFDQLFPEALQAFLWERRFENCHLRIVSNETIIPWSLLALQSPSGSHQTKEGGPFLVEAYKLIQCLTGAKLADHFRFSHVGLFAFGDELPHVEEEKKFIQSLENPLLKVSLIPPTYQGLRAAFEKGEFDVIHFCCHGQRDKTQKNSIPFIPLEGGKLLQLQDLLGASRNLGNKQPLVFFNGCFSGRSGMDLTGESSWLREFMKHGAGAVLGALWEINDAAAFEFTKAFYGAFLDGQPLGAAVQKARLHIKNKPNGTWLSYVCIGDPRARRGQTHLAAGLSNTEGDVPVSFVPIIPEDHPLSPRKPPQEPSRIFCLFWDADRRRTGKAWSQNNLKILATLAIAQEPLTLSMLACFCELQPHSIQPVLEFWAPLLRHEEAIDEFKHAITAYSFQQPAFQTMIIRACQVADSAAVITQAQGNMVRTLEALPA